MAPEPEGSGAGMADAQEQGSHGVGGLVGDGRYRLTHRLGRGGMAEVFAAEDVRLGRSVAVKLLRADLAEDPVSKARFTREAQSVAGLNHHNIVAVYDSGEDEVGGNSVPYIVMELVEGRTIRDLLISSEAPSPDQALVIVSGVLEALAYSHQHGIVHRDIKPANVIITDNGAVKVMDFGIARALHGAQSTMTQTGMVMGTPQYLSPEQALGKAVDHRSDLYATGCLLYELLALRPPFTGETPLSVVYQHVQDTPVPPSEVSDGVPPELDGMVMRALAKDPDDRFQSAEEMRGLIHYALGMLQDQGGHTGGVWSTGPVEMYEGRTPAGGIAATAAMGHPHPVHGETSQFGAPILPPMNPDDGGYDGGYGPHGNAKAGRGKVWLFVAFAIIAITAGVALAVNASNDTKTNEKEPPKVSHSTATTEPSEPAPTPSAEDQTSGDEQYNSNGNSGGHNWNNDKPSWRPSDKATTEQPPTQAPTTDPGASTGSTTGDSGTGTTGDSGTGTTGDSGTGTTGDSGTGTTGDSGTGTTGAPGTGTTGAPGTTG
ncbi:protein kinase [Streptomyces sannanensis]|uniref:non-specific serine/threonine protein kinase n=1 Tax=Streptomyces sannanensis TaxID=285536 RepID=A0ABP6SDE0_9ACTN